MTMTMTETGPARRKRRAGGRLAPNMVPTQATGQPTDSYVYAALDFADVLEPLIEQLDRELGDGAIEAIAARASLIAGRSAEAIKRRIYDIRNGIQRTCESELADALLMALDVMIEDITIPTLPGGIGAARDQVSLHIETTEGRVPSPEEVEPIARRLLRFTLGYVADSSRESEDPTVFAATLDAWIAKKNASLGQALPFEVYDRSEEQLTLEAA